MKLYKAYFQSSFTEGSRCKVLLFLFEGEYNERGAKKVAQLVYESSGESGFTCTIEILKHSGVLKGSLAPTEFAAIATLFIGSKADVRKALNYKTEEESWKKFQSMNAQSETKSHLASELMDTFGSYTAVNHAIMHNIPPVLLSFR